MPKPEHNFTPAPLPVATLDHRERVACLRLIRSDNVGAVTFRELINYFGGAAAALEALPELSRRGGRVIRPCPLDRAEAELDAADRLGATPVFTIEPGYPAALAAIHSPPPLLYIKGRPELLAQPSLGVIGSRQASSAGLALTQKFAAEIGSAGYIIVSGLARGIDAAAHKASLASGTVAVLAGGIDTIYPPEHDRLQRLIAEQGCLVTSNPPGFVPRGKDFPRRNRLVSGMSLGVLVIEAARRSGTLTTARYALEQGREVFAVPGHPLDPRAEGTNNLIKNGATIVTESADVLQALAPMTAFSQTGLEEIKATPALTSSPLASTPQPQDSDRERVLSFLGPHPTTIDDLVRSAGLTAREVHIILMELDLAGRIERHGHHLVSLSQP